MSGNGDYQVSILPMLMLSFTLTYFQYLQHVKTVRDCGAGLSGPAILYPYHAGLRPRLSSFHLPFSWRICSASAKYMPHIVRSVRTS